MKKEKKLKSCAYYLGLGLMLGIVLSNIIPLFIENFVLRALIRLLMPSCSVMVFYMYYFHRKKKEYAEKYRKIIDNM